MKEIILKHKSFYGLFLLFSILSLGILIQYAKGDLILFFSENRTPFLNSFFKIITQLGEAPIYILIGLSYLFIRFRISILFALTGGIVTVITFMLKNIFKAYRPSTYFYHEGKLEQIIPVDGVHLLTGTTSFPSGHTMSAFALFLLLNLFLSSKKRYAFLLFFLALVVGLSRIYLVQHFLQDVLVGAFFGVIIGSFMYFFNQKIPYNSKNWIDRSIKF